MSAVWLPSGLARACVTAGQLPREIRAGDSGGMPDLDRPAVCSRQFTLDPFRHCR